MYIYIRLIYIYIYIYIYMYIYTAPEERTKMRGMAAVESAYTAGRSKGGASMNRSPRESGFGIRNYGLGIRN